MGAVLGSLQFLGLHQSLGLLILQSKHPRPYIIQREKVLGGPDSPIPLSVFCLVILGVFWVAQYYGFLNYPHWFVWIYTQLQTRMHL